MWIQNTQTSNRVGFKNLSYKTPTKPIQEFNKSEDLFQDGTTDGVREATQGAL